MKRFFPKTLTAQTIFVLLLGLTVSHFLSMVIYSSDRVESLSTMGGRNMAQRIASASHLIVDTPEGWRGRIVQALNEPSFKVSISPESMLVTEGEQGRHLSILKKFLRSQIGLSEDTKLFVQLFETPHEGGMIGLMNPNQWMHMQMMSKMHGITSHQSLRVSLELPEGLWLNFATDIPESDPFWSATSILSLALMAIAVIVLSVWVVRRITVPLRSFAHAAKRLGRDVKAPPMSEKGPLEVQEAAQAFNEMQERLRRLVENRTQMMAAISHDLRTPITLLRLRTEQAEALADRNKFLSTLDNMEHMISLTLEFAKQDFEEEKRLKVDMSALIESICEDMNDAGNDIEYILGKQTLYVCAPIAMKRAFTNLIENAIKYADSAKVSLNDLGTEISVVVFDSGPGVPADQLDKITQPFYRCEASRNQKTGGVGLGLSITQSIVQAHGGELILKNLEAGGLEATVYLPK